MSTRASRWRRARHCGESSALQLALASIATPQHRIAHPNRIFCRRGGLFDPDFVLGLSPLQDSLFMLGSSGAAFDLGGQSIYCVSEAMSIEPSNLTITLDDVPSVSATACDVSNQRPLFRVTGLFRDKGLAVDGLLLEDDTTASYSDGLTAGQLLPSCEQPAVDQCEGQPAVKPEAGGRMWHVASMQQLHPHPLCSSR